MGELIDKISILSIKEQKITDESKAANIKTELKLLRESLFGNFSNSLLDSIAPEVKALHAVNRKLWSTEDELRKIEANKGPFGKKFQRLARSVYKDNDERAKLKLAINLKVKSEIVEEKSYAAFDDQGLV